MSPLPVRAPEWPEGVDVKAAPVLLVPDLRRVRVVTFRVRGKPETQGSKVSGVNRHTGRAFMKEGGGAALEDWRNAINAQAQRAMEHETIMTGPVEVDLRFWFARPASHPKTRPTWPTGKKLDLDKLERAAYDSLSSVVFADDGQILRSRAEKDYGPEPGVDITVYELGL